MNQIYLGNAFSLQMLQGNATVQVSTVSKEEVPWQKAISVVGHADTANVLGVPCQRASINLKAGDVLYVAQLVGGRLPEGTTSLPEGFSFQFWKVEIFQQLHDVKGALLSEWDSDNEELEEERARRLWDEEE